MPSFSGSASQSYEYLTLKMKTGSTIFRNVGKYIIYQSTYHNIPEDAYSIDFPCQPAPLQ